MAHPGRAAALFAILSACVGGELEPPPEDPPDGPPAPMRHVVCAHQGTSSVTGSGWPGPLATSRVYAIPFAGFCPDLLSLVVTREDPLSSPYLEDSGVIHVELPLGTLHNGTSWSGTFPATVSLQGGWMSASGTVEVEEAPTANMPQTKLRATARFDDGAWHFTATMEIPYCQIVSCF